MLRFLGILSLDLLEILVTDEAVSAIVLKDITDIIDCFPAYYLTSGDLHVGVPDVGV